MSTVIVINDKSHLEQILNEAKSKADGPAIVVIDFFATWCRPCTSIAPIFKELSTKYTDATFVKVDADKLEDIAIDYQVQALPTFIFLRGSDQIDRLQGGDHEALRSKVQKICGGDEASVDHESVSGAQSSAKQLDLESLLAKTQCECLNEDDSHSLSQLLNSTDGKAYLLSDTDEQLIIYITFSQFIRLQSVQINGPAENGPKMVKIFTNQTSTPDFDSCEAGEPVQALELTEKDLSQDTPVQLNFVKFQNVNTITLFIKNNQTGAEQTRIDTLRFFGYPVNTTNMNEFKRVSGKKGEAHG